MSSQKDILAQRVTFFCDIPYSLWITMLAQYTRIISFEEENTISSDISSRIQELRSLTECIDEWYTNVGVCSVIFRFSFWFW